MPRPLGQFERSLLGSFVARGDRAGYYAQLNAWEYRYGQLAGGVATHTEFSGRVANVFLAEKALERGVVIDESTASQIGVALMNADYDLRTQSANGQIDNKAIEDYHETVFENHGLDITAWTAHVPLKMFEKHYEYLGYASPELAREAAWNYMLDDGFTDGGIIMNTMRHLANGTPIGGVWNGARVRDAEAGSWVTDLASQAVDEALYIFDPFGLGESPFPPDGEGVTKNHDNIGFCFVAGTMVDMANGTQKPIEQINIGDQVMAFDPFLNEGRGGLRPSRVTQTHATPNRVVIDFHGTRVTPGHLFLCGDGPDEGEYSMLLDIIRADGAVVRADGSKVRAATNCALGSEGDRMLTMGYFIDSEDAHARQGEVRIARIRAGTRLLSDDGKDWSFLDAMAEQGFEFFEDGLVAQAGEEPHPFYYFGAPPQPEDYILKKSGFTLGQLLAADEAIHESDCIPVPPAAREPVDVPQTATMQAGAQELRRQQPQAQSRGNRQERRRQKAVQRKKYGETLH